MKGREKGGQSYGQHPSTKKGQEWEGFTKIKIGKGKAAGMANYSGGEKEERGVNGKG